MAKLLASRGADINAPPGKDGSYDTSLLLLAIELTDISKGNALACTVAHIDGGSTH